MTMPIASLAAAVLVTASLSMGATSATAAPQPAHHAAVPAPVRAADDPQTGNTLPSHLVQTDKGAAPSGIWWCLRHPLACTFDR